MVDQAAKPAARAKLTPVAQRIAAELGATAPGPLNHLDRIVRVLGEERALALLAQALLSGSSAQTRLVMTSGVSRTSYENRRRRRAPPVFIDSYVWIADMGFG